MSKPCLASLLLFWRSTVSEIAFQCTFNFKKEFNLIGVKADLSMAIGNP